MRSPELAAALELERVFGPYDPRALGHFTVIRDDGKGHRYEDTGYHAINIHRGGLNGTSSWGCQTLPPLDWPDFIAALNRHMNASSQRWIPYCLIHGPVV